MAVIIAALAGCKSHEPAQMFPNGPTALLAAARASHLTMFGQLSNDRGNEYVSMPVTSLRRHSFADVGADFDVDISPAGDAMAFASTRHSIYPDIYIKGVDGVAVTQLTSDPASDVEPRFSPDGTRIAFASNRAGNWDIWIMSVNGGMPVRVTQSSADEIHPSWSPDGTKLVYCSMPEQGGQWELWIADAIGGTSRRFIGYGLFPDWSPVADEIVYQRARERGGHWFSIWKMQLVDGEPRYPTELAASATQAMILPRWNRDGTQITFATTAVDPDATVVPSRDEPNSVMNHTSLDPTGTPTFDVWTISPNGTNKVRLTDGHSVNYGPTFGPDNRVYFTSTRAGTESIWSVRSQSDPELLPKADHVTGMSPPQDAGMTRNPMRTAPGHKAQFQPAAARSGQ